MKERPVTGRRSEVAINSNSVKEEKKTNRISALGNARKTNSRLSMGTGSQKG